MNKYIGFKMVEAKPKTIELDNNIKREGYEVVYADGYVSWSPKDVFEKAYMQVGDSDNIEEKNITDFILEYHVSLENNTTIVTAALKNGWFIREYYTHTTKNSKHESTVEVLKEEIQDQVKTMLEFLLQTAKEGIK